MSRANGTEQRRRFTADEKATILRRHLVDKVAVSDLCDEYHLNPNVFYLWQRQAFERLSEVLQDGRTARAQTQAVSADRARVVALEAKLVRKDAIIADIAAEHLALKKKLGES
ncbi:MAG: transposase [Thermoanaerobaculia bacterium]